MENIIYTNMYINNKSRLEIKIIEDNYNVKFINNTFRIN